jgi:hypothetical protein
LVYNDLKGQKMKNIFRLTAFLVLSTLLVSQSLVDVAKKEKERREKLKGKTVKVVTNADLKSVRKTAAVTTQTAPPAEAAAAEPEGTEMPEAQEAKRAYDEGQGSPFATSVLPDTSLVENPEFALYPPDGRFAEIPLYGFLILEFSAKNGPGDDIAIHANRRTTSLESVLIGEEDEPLWTELMTYGVLGLDAAGEWQSIGRGSGVNSPERFDLGDLPSIRTIMIIFRYYNEPQSGFKQSKAIIGDYFIGIDAVEALH